MDAFTIAEVCRRSYDAYTVEFDGSVSVLVDGDVIAFQGTSEDGEDILRDMRAIPWHDPDLGWCHSGFLKGVRDGECWEWLADNLKTSTIIAGHSLGGAEAWIVGGLAYKRLKLKVDEIVTFGSPRPGFKKLRNILRPIHKRRFVNGNDCVPNIPWFLGRYKHPVKELSVDSGDGGIFTDHKIANYCEAVR